MNKEMFVNKNLIIAKCMLLLFNNKPIPCNNLVQNVKKIMFKYFKILIKI